MVCSVENGRMAVMSRILRGPSISQNVSGDVGNEKFLARYIRREIIEADEPNLLDEKDMQIYGLKPMDDPLHLVYCSACTRPVKASHYATHADLCGVLSSMRRNEKVEPKKIVERKKPPKKPKRNGSSVRANQLAEGSSRNLIKADDRIPSETLEKVGSFSNVAKGMLPTTYKSAYVPAPMATKIYYSQRNNRLRSEIGCMFHAADSQEVDYNIKVEETQLDLTQSKTSLQRSTPSGQKSCTGLKIVTNPQITDSKNPFMRN